MESLVQHTCRHCGTRYDRLFNGEVRADQFIACPDCEARLEALDDRLAALEQTKGRQPTITCPRCRRMSFNRHDIAEGYCGNCNDWTGGARGVPV